MAMEKLVIDSGKTVDIVRNDRVSKDNEIIFDENKHALFPGDGTTNIKDLPGIFPGSSQEIPVGPSGQFESIKDAVDSITDSSISKLYVVRPVPGVYSESPIVVPDYVEIVGDNVRLEPSDNNSDFITCSGTKASLYGCDIVQPTNATAIVLSGTQTQHSFGSVSGAGPIGIQTTGSGCVVQSATLSGQTTGFDIAGGDCSVVACAVVSAGTAFDVSGDALLLSNAISCVSCTIDLKTSHANAEADITGARINEEKLDIIDFNNVQLQIVSDQEGDEAIVNIQEFHVGVAEKGYESVFGQGDSYTRGMLVYTYDGSDYVDVSEAARSASGSTFTYPNLLVNSAIYVSSDLTDTVTADYPLIQGIKASIQTALVPGSGEIVAEYYNGSWVEFTHFSTQSSGLYYPFADLIFQRTGSEQIRFQHSIIHDWVKNDDPGTLTNRFWFRFRIATAAITTAPVFEQFKLHTSRTELNADGWLEYFGNARAIGKMPWEVGAFLRGSTNPGDQDVFLSKTLDFGGQNNKFTNNITARIAWKTTLPRACDTSCPIKFDGCVITSNTSAGNIRFTLRWGYHSDGGNVYLTTGAAPASAPNELSIVDDYPAPAAAETIKWYSAELDISSLVARRENGFPDTIWVSIERDGSTDSHTGDVTLVAVDASYTKWSDGGHI